MLLEASCSRPSVLWRKFEILTRALVLGVLLFPSVSSGEPKHQDDSVLDDASLLRRRLEEVLKPQPETSTTGEQTQEEGEEPSVEIRSVPTRISLLALAIGKGLTPKRLNDAVERLKEAEETEEVSQAARALAALLNLNPEELKKRYEKLNGELDLEKLFEDLGLEGESFAAQREALKKALEEESQGPVQEEEEGEGEDNPENNPDGGEEEEPPFVFTPEGDDGTAFNPADGNLGDGFLDDVLDDELAQADLGEEEIIDENAQNEQGQDGNNGKNNEKNNNKNKNPGNKNPGAKNPPPPETPPSFPPIGGGGGGGGGAKNPGIQPTKIPDPQAMPAFTPPAPAQEVPLGGELVNALLGRNGNSDKDAQRREDKFQQNLDAYMKLNQTAIQNILQLGAAQAATIGRGPRSQATTTGTPQGAGIADRLRSFSGTRGIPGQSGPRSTGSRVGGMQLRSPQGQLPRPPGYGVRRGTRSVR